MTARRTTPPVAGEGTPSSAGTRATAMERRLTKKIAALSAEVTALRTQMTAGFAADTERTNQLAGEIGVERDARQTRETEEGEKREMRRHGDTVIEQVHTLQAANATKATADRQRIITALAWVGGELLTVIGRPLAPASAMHLTTIVGTAASLLVAGLVHAIQRAK